MLEYLLGTAAGRRVGAIFRAPDSDLHVPALCDVEVVAGLRRAMLAGLLAERAEAALEDYLDLQLTRHGHQRLLGRILELRANFSVYDGTYVALAETLGAGLATADERLANAARAFTTIRVLP